MPYSNVTETLLHVDYVSFDARHRRYSNVRLQKFLSVTYTTNYCHFLQILRKVSCIFEDWQHCYLQPSQTRGQEQRRSKVHSEDSRVVHHPRWITAAHPSQYDVPRGDRMLAQNQTHSARTCPVKLMKSASMSKIYGTFSDRAFTWRCTTEELLGKLFETSLYQNHRWRLNITKMHLNHANLKWRAGQLNNFTK